MGSYFWFTLLKQNIHIWSGSWYRQALTPRAIPVSAAFPKGSAVKTPPIKNHMLDKDWITTKHLSKKENAPFFITRLFKSNLSVCSWLSSYACETILNWWRKGFHVKWCSKEKAIQSELRMFPQFLPHTHCGIGNASLKDFILNLCLHRPFCLLPPSISINKVWKSPFPHFRNESCGNGFLVVLKENKLHVAQDQTQGELIKSWEKIKELAPVFKERN